MPKEFSRTERVAELIRRKLATLIQQKLKDPRLAALVTVSEVKVSKDFSHAKVYVTILPNEPAIIEESMDILNQAASFFRREIGRDLKLRTIPEFRFIHDTLLTEGNRLQQLIDDAVSKDNKES